MRETLVIKESPQGIRRLYVVNEDTDHDQPVRRRLFWPALGQESMAYDDRLKDWSTRADLEVTLSRACGLSDGRYVVTFKAKGAWDCFAKYRIELENGGQTKADYVETEDVAPPKAKVETRYRSGRWEKYLKTRGWVTA